MKAMNEIQEPPVDSPKAGKILRDWLVEKMEANPSYSLRSMARGLGVSPGFLSQVMSGQKKLSIDRAFQFSQVMKLSTEQTRELMRVVTLEQATKGKARALLERLVPGGNENSPRSYTFVEVERFKVLTQWYHLAILDLAETRGFKASPQWISARLKISQVQARSALERLQDLGMLVEEGGVWKKTSTRIAFASKHSNAAVREYHKQMITKGLESLENATPEAFEKRSITGITLSANPERLAEAFEMIDEFRKKLETVLSAGECSEVYQLNVQLFNLSHPIKSGENK